MPLPDTDTVTVGVAASLEGISSKSLKSATEPGVNTTLKLQFAAGVSV